MMYSSEHSIRGFAEEVLLVIQTEYATPGVYVVVFKNVVRIIVALQVPEALKARVNALIEALSDVHLRHYFVPCNKEAQHYYAEHATRNETERIELGH